MLPALQQRTNGVAFDIVAPSLPNFGWSEGVKLKQFGLRDYATVCHRLMKGLGYEKYVAHRQSEELSTATALLKPLLMISHADT